MPYKIVETREFYGPETETTTLADYFGNPETFATRKEAEARVAELDAQPYTTAHNESGRPSYRINRA